MPTGFYPRPSEIARFEKFYIPEPMTGCWLWLGAVAGHEYGYFRLANYGKLVRAHRFAYKTWIGKIPAGFTVDHLCRQRLCVNPQHLEAVTMTENRKRGMCGVLKTHCVHGHEYTKENTYRDPKGGRRCQKCIHMGHMANWPKMDEKFSITPSFKHMRVECVGSLGMKTTL